MVPLITALRAAAPGVDLRFAPKPDKGVEPLREGPVDLDIGVAGTSGPEMRIRLLFRDHFVGAVRAGHPLPGGAITAQTYAACDHVVVSRRGALKGPVDDALAQQGLTRRIAVIVPGFPDAIRLARHSDLVALVPRSCLWNERDWSASPACRHARNRHFGHVAPASRRRSGASLAASDGTGRVPPDPGRSRQGVGLTLSRMVSRRPRPSSPTLDCVIRTVEPGRNWAFTAS
jgi:DNA-binding transcriptional LysR family regulator